MRISSMKTLTPGIPRNKVSMVFWKIPEADEIPKGNWVKRKRPLWVLMMTNFWEWASSLSCWYACVRSSFEKFSLLIG